jgi:hypothetical protein
MARKVFDVSKSREGSWQGKQRGGGVVATASTKEQAVRKTVQAAKSSGGDAQVVIRKADHTIQSERTYGRDPRRRKG